MAEQCWNDNSSITRTQGRELAALADMGPRVVLLVVEMLCDKRDFMPVQLCKMADLWCSRKPHLLTASLLDNAVEKNPKYKVSRQDVANYLVLQRHANLIIEMNRGRFAK